MLIIFIIILLKLSLNFCRINVGVEIGHDGEDDAHCKQQTGKEKILGPLLKEETKTQR